MQSVALAVLAAVGAMAVPAQAQDQDQQERQEAFATERAARQEQRAERQAPQQQQQQQQQERQAPQQAPVARDSNFGGNDGQARAEAREQQRTENEDGWRSQRTDAGQRFGRNWNNGGAVGRPVAADNGATEPAPQRGVTDQARAERWGAQGTGRNRTYSDPARSTSHRGDREQTAEAWRNRTEDRTAQDWRSGSGDRSTTHRPGYREGGYRDGHSADHSRDRHDRNHAYRNGYAGGYTGSYTGGYNTGYNGGYNSGYNSGSRDHRQWNRNDWRRDNRYNWSGYRNQHRDLFRAGRYYSPYNNYSYSRLSIGFFLNSGFYGQNYWIDDPYQYRLPEVYGPYRWVRYYDDVLLVDIYSGQVVDVIHDFFW